MRNLAGIVLGEASAEVGSAADVALIEVRETTEDVGVVHGDIHWMFQSFVFLYCTRFLLPNGR